MQFRHNQADISLDGEWTFAYSNTEPTRTFHSVEDAAPVRLEKPVVELSLHRRKFDRERLLGACGQVKAVGIVAVDVQIDVVVGDGGVGDILVHSLPFATECHH